MFVEKSCQLTSMIMRECIENFCNFKSEIDVARFLKNEVLKNRCKLAFRPVVVSGNNFLEIHHKADNTKLKGFVIIDFGVKYKGTCGDMTRTVYVGRPSGKDLELYDLVLRLYRTALRELKIRMRIGDLDMMIRNGFGKFMKNFKHSLGHGVSKRVHSGPTVSFRNNRKFKKGMIVAIEPGLYFRSKGVRIEDTVFIGKRNKILTKGSKELRIF